MGKGCILDPDEGHRNNTCSHLQCNRECPDGVQLEQVGEVPSERRAPLVPPKTWDIISFGISESFQKIDYFMSGQLRDNKGLPFIIDTECVWKTHPGLV